MVTFPEIFQALDDQDSFTIAGEGSLPSAYAVTDLAVETIAAAARQVTLLTNVSSLPEIDRRLASYWFKTTTQAAGWKPQSLWDPVTGDYQTQDGWLRIHANAAHHREAALAVLGLAPDAATEVPSAVVKWSATELETAIVEAGGCAAEMRDAAAWACHPQGSSVANEPLIHWQENEASLPAGNVTVTMGPRPLKGIRVLDLTRVIAGPTATRLLAALGAEVLRIDPPWWDEPAVALDMTVGKRCAGLDLRLDDDRSQLMALAADADLLVHGYRPGALDGYGIGPTAMRQSNPGLIDISLCAFGWIGPWAGRRGFDSLVQMSSGIAHHGMVCSAATKPTPLPAQALDHATGYLAAAACLRALRIKRDEGRVLSARLSLARTAELLKTTEASTITGQITPLTDGDFIPTLEQTDWGPVRRLPLPFRIEGLMPTWDFPEWDTPARDFRTSPASWVDNTA